MAYPRCQRFFFPCCLLRKLSGEAAIVTSGKSRGFFPARHNRGFAVQLTPQKTGKKKTSGTQGKNGVTMTPNRRLSTLIFICCFSKSLLIKNWKQTIIVRESRALELASHLSSNTYNTEQSDFAYG